jgi:ferredoxin
MCRLFAMSSETPESPMVAMQTMDVMREGHDGSGVGLFLHDLGGPFEEIKDAPILSGIFTDKGLKRLDASRCIGCGFCAGACPCGIWDLVENAPLG